MCADLGRQHGEKRIERLGERIYCAVGFGLSNVTMVAVDGGKVIVDSSESVRVALEVKAEFDRLVPGPVRSIIYTHSHPDHILGASVFHSPGVPIWASARFLDEIRSQMGSLASTLRKRGARQFGNLLPPESYSPPGIGPALRLDEDEVPPLMFPTNTFRDHAHLEIGGLAFELREAPGETHDHLFVHLPQLKAVLAGDNIYRAFPNLYAIRGVTPRPVREWIESLDKIRYLEPELLALGHTEPIRGREQISQILTAYRDAIAYVHSSVIRLINAGCTPDQMAHRVRLPEHLRTHPYLQETYGKIPWAVRGIYEGYLGWFDGNATRLKPLSPEDYSSRIIGLAGGRAPLRQGIDQALRHGDAQWAAELCDLLLAAGPDDDTIRRLKAAALERLAEEDANPVARNYYRTSAAELRGDLMRPPRAAITVETVRHVPVEVFIQSLPTRLIPEQSAELTLRVGFEFPDTDQRFTFYIRRGVGEIRAGVLDKPDFVITAKEVDFKAFVSGALSKFRALMLRKIRCSGGWSKLKLLRSVLSTQ